MRFADGAGGTSIGYKGDVILPLRVVPQDAGKPVTLRLKLDYAVCEKLCVPAKAKLELHADRRRRRAATPRVGAAEARVPKRCRGRRPRHALRSARCAASRRGQAARRRRCRRARGRRRSTCSPKARPRDWALPLPEPVAGAPAGLQRFAFELDGLPPGAKPEGRHAPADGRRRRAGDRGRIPSRLIRRSALIWRARSHQSHNHCERMTIMAIKVGDRVPSGTFHA